MTMIFKDTPKFVRTIIYIDRQIMEVKSEEKLTFATFFTCGLTQDVLGIKELSKRQSLLTQTCLPKYQFKCTLRWLHPFRSSFTSYFSTFFSVLGILDVTGRDYNFIIRSYSFQVSLVSLFSWVLVGHELQLQFIYF